MGITHVIRGDDHVNNTPRQINILQALGAPLPVYAHLPTVLTPEGEKLSKRHGAKGVLQYKDDGYLPEAVVNYLARLGWAHGDDEVFTREEFVAWFDLAHLSSHPARFDPDKLKWVNHEHLKRLTEDELGIRFIPYLKAAGLDPVAGAAPGAVAMLLRDRVATFEEMADAAHYFYATPHASSDKVAEFVNAANRPALVQLAADLEKVDWKREPILAAIKANAAQHGLKAPQVMMPLRVLVCGTPQTPAIDAVLFLLGRETTRARLTAALAKAG